MNEDFEKRLQRVDSRKIPAAWREEILSAARESVATSCEPPVTREGLLPRLIQEFLIRVRQPRVAWAGVGAAWLVILGLHFSGGPDSTTPATTSAIAKDQTRLALKQKQLLLAELAGAVETKPPVVRPSGPRSQRREDMTAA